MNAAAMTIRLSNSSVLSDAQRGTIIGTLSTDQVSSPSFVIIRGRQLFQLAVDRLLTAWVSPQPPGSYSVAVFAYGDNWRSWDFSMCLVTITVAPKTMGLDLQKIETKTQPTPPKPGP